jgi:hypothetical protein
MSQWAQFVTWNAVFDEENSLSRAAIGIHAGPSRHVRRHF